MSKTSNEGRTTRRIKQVEPDSKYVLERYLLDNGAHEVVLLDETESTWEAYCKDIASQKRKATAKEWDRAQTMASRDERAALLVNVAPTRIRNFLTNLGYTQAEINARQLEINRRAA